MATLILSAVGRLIGGRVGGAVGAVIGQQLDGKLFGPKGGSGPRLNDLAFQSSTYGAQIPKLFGRMRAAGSVIWATDLQEDRRKVSTGKGKPKQTVYSYSASFAVVLSARKASRIGRIWADGKLLRGEAGDFKTQTGFRFHGGEEGQAPDPLIAAAEGAGQAPAYRGMAYAVFEDFQLADYGNRIPSLSFEVIADEAAVSIGTVIEGLAAEVVADCPTLLDGIAVSGDSVRGVINTVASVVDIYGSDNGVGLTLSENSIAALPLLGTDLGTSASARRAPRIALDRASPDSVAQRRLLAYYDVTRDYQQGSQSVSRPGGSVREERHDFAAALSPAQAKALISRQLARDLAGREKVRISLPWRYATLIPGQSLTLPGLTGRWLISNAALEAMVVQLTLKRLASPAQLAYAADPGRSISEGDLMIGTTLLALLDLPWLGTGLAIAPSLSVAAAGTGIGWRSAALLQSVDAGVSVEEIGSTAAPAVIGSAATPLGVGSSAIFDRVNAVEVTLANTSMTLSASDTAGLIAGRNLASLGSELFQFERAEALGGNRYRLSGLLRGRRGTEFAVSGHQSGEQFVLIDSDALAPIAVSAGLSAVQIWASGVGDSVPSQATLTAPGLALRPLSPVHVRVEAGSDALIRWVRRSRDGWRWDDFVDAPLGEEGERYRLTLSPSVGPARLSEVGVPEWSYSAAERASDVALGATSLMIAVQQIGTYGLSRPSTLTFPLTS
jgi:Putative phage tail protein